MRVHRLQTRIIVLFVALLVLVQAAAFWFVNAANSRNASAKVEEELIVGERVFAISIATSCGTRCIRAALRGSSSSRCYTPIPGTKAARDCRCSTATHSSSWPRR
jgi:hypothetical protein